MKTSPLSIITPVFNDWDSLKKLILELDHVLLKNSYNAVILIINDASTIPLNRELIFDHLSAVKKIEVLNLTRNTGHQHAIATGLAYLEKYYKSKQIIIMDADGEDSPSDIPRLVDYQSKAGKIIFAKRGQRKDGMVFKFYYFFYRLLFLIMTGKEINFGNFCVLPEHSLRQIVSLPDIWGHFAAGIVRSGIPFQTIIVDRKSRYYGESKMSFINLLIHGMKAISIFSDVLITRLILGVVFFIISLPFLGGMVIYIKYYTNLAIPGWTSTIVIGLFMALLQSLVLLFSLSSHVLYSRILQFYTPARFFNDYVLNSEVIYGE